MSFSLTAGCLKLIAIIAMAVDHAADLLFPGFPAHPAAVILHAVGRLTAPIMWFFLCEGFHHTRNLKRYMMRMFALAVLSHFAYCFAFGISWIPFRDGVFNQTSVIWPLAWALVALWILHRSALKEWQKWLLVMLINLITFPSDWSCIAVMAVVVLYEHRGNLTKQMTGMLFWVAVYSVVSFFFVSKTYALVQLAVVLVWPLLRRYNGQKGRNLGGRWFFYLFYPAHLILVGALRLLVYGNIPLLF